MFKSYLKTAWRNLLRHKGFSLINITGLAIGLACCLLLVLYLRHELSYDRFHGKASRIVRVIMDYKIGEEGNKGNFTSTKVFPEFKRQFPEVESGVRMVRTERLVKYESDVWVSKDFLYADSTFFQVFDFGLESGKVTEVLDAPNKVVLTRSAARKYFGNEDPVGKTVIIGSSEVPYQVTGVTNDCPSNSQIQFNAVASISSFGTLQEETYSNANYVTYLLMNDASSLQPLQRKISEFMAKESAGSGWQVDFELEPFTRIHLHSPYDAFIPNTSIYYIYIIIGVALLILIIACFTYVNLSTARSTERAREVGVRKVAGAFRLQLFWQFISESALLTLASLFISFALAVLLLPFFNELAGTSLSQSQLLHPFILITALVIASVIALLAGSYPALVLSRFQPVKVLKGVFKNSGSGTLLRKSLIVFQFVISVFLIISTFVIKSQLSYIQQKKLGYNKDNVLVVDIDQKLVEKMDLVKSELSSLTEVEGISSAYNSPVAIHGGYNMSGTDLSKSMAVTANLVDESFIKVTGLELIAGSDLTERDVKEASKEDYSKNYYHFILNESAAKALGWTPTEAIGKKMYLDESRPGEVKGVVKDFHFASLHSEIKPLVLFPGGWRNSLFVKLNGSNIPAALSAIAAKWKKLAPHRPFSYHFLDEDYQQLYEAEMRTGKLFNVFAGLAVLLACLGLFGLSAYSARQRVKEIGVRKVLGASVSQISLLLSSGFLKLVVISFLIASPLAWLAMSKWLNQFNYRVGIEWWVFMLAGLTALLLALITVSFQAIKAAVANPVKSLRTE